MRMFGPRIDGCPTELLSSTLQAMIVGSTTSTQLSVYQQLSALLESLPSVCWDRLRLKVQLTMFRPIRRDSNRFPVRGGVIGPYSLYWSFA
jgi:hypothetical protein